VALYILFFFQVCFFPSLSFFATAELYLLGFFFSIAKEKGLRGSVPLLTCVNEPVLCKKLTKIPCGTNYRRLAIRSWSYSSVPGNFIPSMLWAFLFLTSATLDQCLMGSLSVGGSSHFVLQSGPSWPISVWPLRAHCRRSKEEHHAPLYCNGLGERHPGHFSRQAMPTQGPKCSHYPSLDHKRRDPRILLPAIPHLAR